MNELVLRVMRAAVRAWTRPFAVRRPRRTVPGNRKRLMTPIQKLAKRRRDSKWRALHKSQVNMKRRLRYKRKHSLVSRPKKFTLFRPSRR